VRPTAAEILASVIVDELVRCGVREACVAPGSRSGPLARAFNDAAGIRVHVRIDERSASFLALGMAKSSRIPAVAVSTSGTAAANFLPAVIEAERARVPLIVITADRPPELRGTGANQTIDQTKLYGDTVRWWAEVHSDMHPEAGVHWRSVASHLWQRACGSPQGPVHLNVSLREPLTGGDHDPTVSAGRPGGRPWHAISEGPRPAPDSIVDRLASLASETEKGLIVAGDCDLDPTSIASLARCTGWPLLAEPTSGLRGSERAISTYDALLRAPSWADRHRPDFVLRIGNIGASKALLGWLDPTVDQVLVDVDGEWLDPSRSIAEILRADPSIFAEQLVKALDTRAETSWSSSWMRAEGSARRVIDEILDTIQEPTEPRIARDLADAMAPDGIIVAASSMPVRDLDSFMRVQPGVRIIANRGASGIDGFPSTAIGVALSGSRPAAALSGDLSMLHDVGGLVTLDGPIPDLNFVVLNNNGGGIFSFLRQSGDAAAFERLFGTPHGLDFARLAALYGCGYSLLQSADELVPTLSALSEGLGVVEVRTDRARNVELHKRIWRAVETMLGEAP
jgi:2-succinyl-5-enolpyruvyl-6-hydroxy-3-cyclohexene-1-carboxylate synthase